MSKKVWMGIAFAVVVVAIIAGILATHKRESEIIKVGVVLPLSGDGAAYGKKEKNGIALAIEKANASSGAGKKIVAIYEDSQGIPAPAVSATRKLITVDKVQVIIGGAFSSPTLAIVPVADKNRVVVMSPTASSPKLSGSSRYFFRVWPSDIAEGSKMAEIAVQRLGLESFAVLYGNNEYALGLKDVFVARIKELGKTVTTVEVYNEGDSDFRAQLAKIKAQSPDGIYLAGYYKEFAKILKQAKELGIETQFMSCGTFHEPEVLKLAGGAAEGVVFVQPYFNRESQDPVTKDFVTAYEKKFGIEAGVYAAHGYDAARVICKVVKGGKTTAEEIQQALLDLKDFPGVTGKTTFIEGGNVIKPARVMTVTGGRFIDFSN